MNWSKMGKISIFFFAIAVVTVIAGCNQQSQSMPELQDFIERHQIDTNKVGWRSALPKPPKLTFDSSKRYYWKLETNVGVLGFQLRPDVAPMHVSSTLYLTRLGFYDGLTFHRVIPGFMAQGGDPLGNGTGGPGYHYAGEFDPRLRHSQAGMLSMANAGPGTDGSQFFITFSATPHLNGRHTVFGILSEGLDVLRRIETQGTASGRTLSKVYIKRASIEIKDGAD